ncbi:MAG: uroporphyrinogen-III C-methyltransferase, partial [Calditrichota bacterium]
MNDNQPTTGKVYLIGAGPGHPGLITRWGGELLETCDAVVYDDLIPLELVAGLPSTIEKHYVGKRSGRHSATQTDINELIIKLAQRGLNVARLKGGDPTIFGRGGEELATLTQAGIRAFIIPGVTAATTAAASGGISLTDRRSASWLMLATGKGAESDSPPVPWREIASLKGGTLCVYMGVGELEHIAGELQAGGMDPKTPVLIIQNAGSGIQRQKSSTLGKVVDVVQNSQIQPPALIIIGPTAASSEGYKNTGALTGKRVLVTRPSPQCLSLCRLIREQGGEPLPYPTIAIEPFDDVKGWDDFKRLAPLGGWCVFTSEAGVNCFFNLLLKKGLDVRSMGRFSVAAVGRGTAAALSQRGIIPDLIPERALVSSLAQSLAKVKLTNSLVVRVRGNLGDYKIEETAERKSAQVLSLTVYHNLTAEWLPYWISQVIEQPPDYITFTSGSTVDGFVQILGIERAQILGRKAVSASIGPSTSTVMRKYGFEPVVEAEEH